jgi:hypothetical protein
MQRGAAEENDTMQLSHVPTAQLKQMLRTAEHEHMMTPEHNAYCVRYREGTQTHLDELCKELGAREEC